MLITGVGGTLPDLPLFFRTMISWLRSSNNILVYNLSRRKCHLEDGIGVRLISKVLSRFTDHSVLLMTLHFPGQDLVFLVGHKTAFELPLQFVANSNIAGRTEVSLEFQPQNLTKSKPSKHAPDEMAEIRFFVPGTQAKSSRSDGGSQKSDAEDEGEEISAAQAFHNTIKERAEIGQATGDIILSFEEVLVLTPRGRYDVDLYHDFFRLRGKTYDYKIIYSTIQRLFLLPKDDLHVLFIVSIGCPDLSAVSGPDSA